MASYNRIIMAGNLTRDPEYKQLASGQAVCRLGVASNRQFKNRQSGDMVQEVCFIDVDVWGPQAESCRQYLQKGRPVLIEGRLKFDTWQDTNGQTRSKHTIVADRVVFLGTAQDNSAVDEYDASSKAQTQSLDENNPVERALMNQIADIKSKITTQKKVNDIKMEPAQSEKSRIAPSKAKKEAVDEMIFNDEPPFQDDLPF